VTDIERLTTQAGELPDDVRTGITQLLSQLQAATTVGDAWLEAAAGPELATLHLRARVHKAYGVPDRDD
jgi:hypothetical protein